MSDVSDAGLQPDDLYSAVMQLLNTAALNRKMARKACKMGRYVVICLLPLNLLQPALAQNADAQSVKIGEADLTPAVRITYVRDSNAFLTSNNEVDATGVIVSPEATLRADRRLLSIVLGYRGAFGLYSEDALDYNDHALTAAVNTELSSRHRFFSSLALD